MVVECLAPMGLTLASVQCLLRDSEAWVREETSAYDASHDWMHAFRVRKNAELIAKREGLEGDSFTVVSLAALMHDVGDHKYTGSETASSERITGFLGKHGVPEEWIRRVCFVVDNISFTKETRKLRESGGEESLDAGGGGAQRELECVQDADRLDAIGAVGIARCFTYGGAMKRPLYNPELCSGDALAAGGAGGAVHELFKTGCKESSVQHFYDKLLLLKGMLKTRSGRVLAEQRHQAMLHFLDSFQAEILGQDDTGCPPPPKKLKAQAGAETE